MGADILRAVSNESHSHTARQLLTEWVKFRWGVFDENGHEGDPLYPAYYRDPVLKDLRPNRCYGLHEQTLPFCDSKNHVPEAPTKHNALCMGRPAWDIIQQSEDFADGKNQPSNETILHEPIYRYVQESSPRFILVVEDTAVMNMQRRWEFVRKAVRRITVYDVPDGTYIGLVVFNSVANTVAPLSKIDSISDVRQRIGSSLPRNPSTAPESHKCVLCGLQEALRVLNNDPLGATGANIILVTTGAGTATHHQMDEMVRMVQNSGVKVIPIIYPLTEKPGTTSSSAADNLEPLIRSSGGNEGRMFTIVDEGVGNDSKVSMMIALMDALLAAIQIPGTTESPGTPVIIHSEAFPGGISSMSTGSFNLDDSLGPSARFSVYYYDLNHVGNTIQLTTPSGSIMASVNIQEEDGDANVIFVNIPKAERGLWKYKVENRADSHQGLHIQVTAFENPKRKISVKLWTNAVEPLKLPDPSHPVILYAEVKDDEVAVIGAQVRAKLQRLGTNATRYPYEPLYINLFDNGVGDPDITKGDGIYSRYLPQLYTVPGHYELSISADHNGGMAKAPSIDTLSRRSRMFGELPHSFCCGSVLKYEHMKPVSPFRRELSFGILNIVSASPDQDVIPPSRILDLRPEVNETTHEVTLRWTAPGDDYDWGRAHHYEIVIASSWAEAKAFEGEKLEDLPIPHMVALEQSFTFDTNRFDQISYIAIRAVDNTGNKGGVSNIASIWVPHPPTTRAPITTPSLDFPSSYSAEPQGHGLTQPIRVAGLNLEDVAVIAGSVGGFLMILTVLTTFCYCHVSRRRKEQQKKDSEKLEANRNVMIKTNSSIMIDQDDSRDSADSVVKDSENLKDGRSLSPVQSWAASKLLAEHERRFSVSSGPVVEQHGSVVHYGTSLHDPFPDVTLTGTQSYPSSQTPSTTHSDPPAYQPSYVSDGYNPYPYPYNTPYNPEDLPPYTPGISSSQSSQSSAYTQEAVVGQPPSEMSYPHEVLAYHAEIPSYVADASYSNTQTASYNNVPENPLRPPLAARKVPPPVAPKPQISTRSNISPTNSATSSEPKRRNVTQV
ncbi:Calcium-activated chloride channel regulator 4 [Armadillidium vulgare]|nr:Calcium-activated chloride channel regulator 4 [Armadillidium vulgare]